MADGEDWICPYCEGQSGLLRTSDNGGSCRKSSCRKKHRAVLERERAGEDVPVGRAITSSSGSHVPQNCYEVIEVLGHKYHDVGGLPPSALRNGRELQNEDIMYLVRARFGDEEDEEEKQAWTKWVLLEHMLEHVTDQDDLDEKLDKYASQLKAKMRAARRALRA